MTKPPKNHRPKNPSSTQKICRDRRPRKMNEFLGIETCWIWRQSWVCGEIFSGLVLRNAPNPPQKWFCGSLDKGNFSLNFWWILQVTPVFHEFFHSCFPWLPSWRPSLKGRRRRRRGWVGQGICSLGLWPLGEAKSNFRWVCLKNRRDPFRILWKLCGWIFGMPNLNYKGFPQ